MPLLRRMPVLLVIAAAALACCAALGATSAAAAAATTGPAPLTICPALGTVGVTTSAGSAACVQNDCASIARATVGTSASCEAASARPATLMSIQPATPFVAEADALTGSLAAVAPADAPDASWQSITIRALVGVGIAAFLLAGALYLSGRRIGVPGRSATQRPAEAA